MTRRLRSPAILLLTGDLVAGVDPSTAQMGVDRPAAIAAMPLFAIIYRAGPNWKAGAPLDAQSLRDHLLYLGGLSERGVVMVAGPFGADGGLIIA